MLVKLMIFFIGVIVGISGTLISVVLSLEREVMKKKRAPTKDEWRTM